MKNFLFSAISLCLLVACGNTNGSDEELVSKQENSSEINTEETFQEGAPDPIPAKSSDEYSYEVIIDDLDIPWGFDFFPDGSMIITEKEGEIIHYKNGRKIKIQGAPEVYNRGQGGLLDVALHPDYVENGWIYFTYSSTEGEGSGGNTALMRAKLNGNLLTNQKVLYKASPNTNKGQHFGSRIAFDKEGYLFFSIGERGAREVNPQDITRDNGKIYRLNPDGSIPSDNPFADRSDAVKAIYSYGHRNPQGMILNPETGEIWVHEHGPKGGDEINIIKKGANYGWPIVTYGENYNGTPITEEKSRPEMEDPIFYWLPSIAPSGFEYVTSENYPDLKGDLLVGSLKFQYLEHLVLERNRIIKREKLIEGVGRVRDVNQGPDGNIYIAVEGKGIIKLTTK